MWMVKTTLLKVQGTKNCINGMHAGGVRAAQHHWTCGAAYVARQPALVFCARVMRLTIQQEPAFRLGLPFLARDPPCPTMLARHADADDNHIPNLSVLETVDFAGRCLTSKKRSKLVGPQLFLNLRLVWLGHSCVMPTFIWCGCEGL